MTKETDEVNQPSDGSARPPKMVASNALDWIKKYSSIVVDSGDLKWIRHLQTEDATTNPTLLLQCVEAPETAPFFHRSIRYGKLLLAFSSYCVNSASFSKTTLLESLQLGESAQKAILMDSTEESILNAAQDIEPFIIRLNESINDLETEKFKSVYEKMKFFCDGYEADIADSIGPTVHIGKQEEQWKALTEYFHKLEHDFQQQKKALKTAAIFDIICELTVDYFMVLMGCEILKYIPGVVSTELPPKYSFDVDGSIQKAQHITNLYAREGISKQKVLVKLASTWEGICAAKYLESTGIHCNMTLLFSLPQAIAAAEANVTLISPFVGRILDWYKLNEPNTMVEGEFDPGVQRVQSIYKYYKKFGHRTIVMAASFRNTNEILQLAGCDKLTISPKLLNELSNIPMQSLESKLSSQQDFKDVEKLKIDEKAFRWKLNEDRMANEKLSEGIRNFQKDYKTMISMVSLALKAKD